jgi:hypothetical protein
MFNADPNIGFIQNSFGAIGNVTSTQVDEEAFRYDLL